MRGRWRIVSLSGLCGHSMVIRPELRLYRNRNDEPGEPRRLEVLRGFVPGRSVGWSGNGFAASAIRADADLHDVAAVYTAAARSP